MIGLTRYTHAVSFPPEHDGELHIQVDMVDGSTNPSKTAYVSFTIAFDDRAGLETQAAMLRRVGKYLVNNPIKRIKS